MWGGGRGLVHRGQDLGARPNWMAQGTAAPPKPRPSPTPAGQSHLRDQEGFTFFRPYSFNPTVWLRATGARGEV